MKIYAYGMTVWSTIHRLAGEYPREDTYGEIAETHTIPGGEAANAALLLGHWGHEVVLDGCHTGELTRDPLTAFFADTGVDISLMKHEPGFAGWRDIVLCTGKSRTIIGWFGGLFSHGAVHWTEPSQQHVAWADCVLLDPFFPGASRALAAMCVEAGTDYLTVDCRHEDPIARDARAIVVSGEFLDQQYPGVSAESRFDLYAQACRGLVVFTAGSKPVRFRPPGRTIGEIPALELDVVDTLAAGDSFRAGLAQGLLEGETDGDAVRLGVLTSAAVCQRFPSIHPMPSLREIRELGHRV